MFAHLLAQSINMARRLAALPYQFGFHLARGLVLPAPRRRPIRLPLHPLARTPVSYAEAVAIETRRRFWWLS
jgi:hypothetical protein